MGDIFYLPLARAPPWAANAFRITDAVGGVCEAAVSSLKMHYRLFLRSEQAVEALTGLTN